MTNEWQHYLTHRPEIQEILDPRCHTIEWLDDMVATGDAQLFANHRAAIITEIRHHPAGATELHGLVAAGHLSAILELIAQAEQWGREQGCTFASIASREGWAKVLPDYAVHQVVIRKELG